MHYLALLEHFLRLLLTAAHTHGYRGEPLGPGTPVV